MAVLQAIGRSFEAVLRPDVARLPTPVRLRATRALQAWEIARRIAGPEGARLSALLADPAVPPLELLQQQAEFVAHHVSLDNGPGTWGHIGRSYAIQTVFRQAFWARGGALYEPTPALHRLLDATDVGQDVPLRLVRLPVPALCVVPEPKVRDAASGFVAMLVFEHAIAGTNHRGLSFILQRSSGDEALVLDIEDENRTLVDAFAHAQRVSMRPFEPALDGAQAYADWRPHLEYVTKLLLYLSLHNAQVVHEHSYTGAPRVFPGLGKRKREQRLAEVERLYDRYVVGPAALPEGGTHASPSDGHGGEVMPHWRRGHFRLQPHGPQASLRRLMFISPMLVRADRLVQG